MPTHEELLGLSDRELLALAPEATHQHFKGGLYKHLGLVHDADTGLPLLSPDGDFYTGYEHVYPHERKIWIRRSCEWGDFKGEELRFRPLMS